MKETSTHQQKPLEPDPVNFYRVASERHLRPNELLVNHFTTPEITKQVPNSKFTSANALIAKAIKLIGLFETLSERHDEPFRIAGPAHAVKDYVRELELHITYHEEPTATNLRDLHKRYTICLERFKRINGLEYYL